MSMYAPAGYESDSDEDGFVFGDDIEKKAKPKPATQMPPPKSMTPKGGFGVPTGYKSKDVNGTDDSIKNTSPYAPSNFKDVVIRGSLEQVKEMVHAGMPVDVVLKCGWTVLMYSANMAFPDKLAYLIEAGANVNYHKDQYTVLMTACACNRSKVEDIYQCVLLLLDNGANINTYDRYHSSPLMNASREGHELIVTKLIEQGANVNKQNNRGWTALSWAVSKGHTKVVEILLAAGADKEKMHTDGQKPLEVARFMGHEEIVKLLGGTLDINEDSATAYTDVTSVHSAPEKSFQTYGELELFLSGLSLTQLIPVFQNHKITFEMLLQVTDKELVEMDIKELGNRKRILDGVNAIHKKDWQKSSVPSVTYNKTLTYEDMLAMVANISMHQKYICSSLTCVNTQSRGVPAMLEQSTVSVTDGLGPKLLEEKCAETLGHLKSVEAEIHQLQAKCHTILKKGYFKSPDVIDQSTDKKPTSYTRLKFASSAAIIGLVIYFRVPIISKILDVSSRIQRLISVDVL